MFWNLPIPLLSELSLRVLKKNWSAIEQSVKFQHLCGTTSESWKNTFFTDLAVNLIFIPSFLCSNA